MADTIKDCKGIGCVKGFIYGSEGRGFGQGSIMTKIPCPVCSETKSQKSEMGISDVDTIRHKICCVYLLNTIADNHLDMRGDLGHVWINKHNNNCASGLPWIKFCPFCGAELNKL